MSRRLSDGTFTITPEPARTCSECGAVEECRPYGKNGAVVCFDCAMKDEAEAKQQFSRRMSGKVGES